MKCSHGVGKHDLRSCVECTLLRPAMLGFLKTLSTKACLFTRTVSQDFRYFQPGHFSTFLTSFRMGWPPVWVCWWIIQQQVMFQAPTPPPPRISLSSCLIKETASHYFTGFPVNIINLYIWKLVLKAPIETLLSEAFLSMLFKAFLAHLCTKKLAWSMLKSGAKN